MVARESRARAGGQGGQGGQAGRGDGDGEQFEVRGTGEQGAVPTIVPGSSSRFEGQASREQFLRSYQGAGTGTAGQLGSCPW